MQNPGVVSILESHLKSRHARQQVESVGIALAVGPAMGQREGGADAGGVLARLLFKHLIERQLGAQFVKDRPLQFKRGGVPRL